MEHALVHLVGIGVYIKSHFSIRKLNYLMAVLILEEEAISHTKASAFTLIWESIKATMI